MNTNSNTYTVIYATVLVLLVAAILAFVSVSLKDRQQANVDTETRQSILSAAFLGEGADEADNKNAYVEAEYNKYITESFLVNAEGEKVEGNAFSLALKSQYDIMKQSNPDASKLTLPVFVCTLDSGEKVEILPLYGAGLWGPIWGYIALKDDYNTIYGAAFLHQGETPGLGAEIATDKFRNQLVGKQIFGDNDFSKVAFTIVKNGTGTGNINEIDGVSGGTITSNALGSTIDQWFTYYIPYLEKQRAEAVVAAEEEAVPAEQTNVEGE